MVRLEDLGYQSKNLEDLPEPNSKKDKAREQAIRNLTSVAPPDRLTTTALPDSLFKGL